VIRYQTDLLCHVVFESFFYSVCSQFKFNNRFIKKMESTAKGSLPLVLNQCQPYPFAFDPQHTALLVIDMQRDFLEPNGFGASLGNNVSLLASTLTATAAVLTVARSQNLTVVHTREGHLPDLSDLTWAKRNRGREFHSLGRYFR